MTSAIAVAESPAAIAREAQTALLELPERALDADGLFVLVRMRDTRVPVEGATVRWLDEWELAYKRLAIEELLEPDLERRLERLGSAGKTGSDGTLRVPWPRAETRFFARAGEASAHGYAHAHARETLILELTHEEALELRVVDAAGRPQAGVPVALSAGSGRQRRIEWKGTTGFDGSARCSAVNGWPLREVNRILSAGFAFPVLELVEYELDLGPGPLEPVTLVLPPTGSLRVRVLVHDGRPSTRDGVVSMFVSDRVDASADSPEFVRDETTYDLAFVEGEAHMPCIGLGLPLELGIRTLDDSTTFRHRAVGPRHPGEQMVLDLRDDPQPPTIRGRALIAETGAPLAHARLRAEVMRAGAKPVRIEPVPTDAQGRFAIPELVRAKQRAEGGARSLRLSLPRGPGPLRACEIDLTYDLSPQGVELGDCRLSTDGIELIAAGRVLERASGEPIAGARVALMRRTEPEDDGESEWTYADFDCAYSDAQGAFELRGDAPQGELALGAAKQRYLSAPPVPLAFGDANARLHLELGASIAGNVLVAPDIDPTDLELLLSPMDAVSDDDGTFLERHASGAFEGAGIEPGLYRLRIAESERAPPLLEIADLALRAGETTRDARLVDIDLRTLLRHFDVRVFGPNGRPVEDGRVHVLAPELGPDRWRNGERIRDGRARVLASTPTVDLNVSAPGLRTQRIERIERVEGELDVHLEAGLAVRLILVGEGRDSEARVLFQFFPEIEANPEDPFGDVRLADNTQTTAWVRQPHASVVLGSPGRWIVIASHGRPLSGRPDHGLQPADGSSPWVLDVLDLPDEQHFTLEHAPVPAEPAASAK